MGLQKYRFDKEGGTHENGSRAVFSNWMGGPSLAGVRNCPVNNAPEAYGPDLRRTVYATGMADTFFSIPAACKIKGKTCRGFLSFENDRGYYFVPTEDFDWPYVSMKRMGGRQ